MKGHLINPWILKISISQSKNLNIFELLKMVDLSHLFSLADFSLIDFIFGDNKSKNQNNPKEEGINIKKNKINKDSQNFNIINKI